MFKNKTLEKALNHIDKKNYKGLESILKKGFDPFYKGKKGKSIYDAFILDKDIRKLVDSYASVFNLPDRLKKSCEAVLRDDVDTLLKLTPNCNDKDSTGRTLLTLAFENRKNKAADYLLNNAESIEEKRSTLGAAFGNAENFLIRKLLEKVDLKESIDEELIDYLHYQTIYNNNEDGLLVLLDYIDMKKDGPELFNESIRNSGINMVRLYLSKGADPNGIFDGKTPLMALSGRNCFKDDDGEKTVEIAKLLVENGSDPETEDEDGKKAEYIAFERNLSLGYYLRDLNFDIEKHLKMLRENLVPDEVFQLLGGKNSEVNCDSSYEMRKARLCSLKQLRKGNAFISSWEYLNNIGIYDPNFKNDGKYIIPVIEFIREQKSHGENGILIWIPKLSMFGSCDTNHGVVTVFKDVNFKTIMENPCEYLNAQWTGFGADIYDVCEPNKIFKYKEI